MATFINSVASNLNHIPAPATEKEIDFPSERNGLGFILKARKEKLNFLVNLMRCEGSHVGYKIFNDPILLLTDATAVQSIFVQKNEDFKRSKYIKNLRYLFSGGIFLTDGETWKTQRTEAAPAFSNGNFPEMTKQMVSVMDHMIKSFDRSVQSRKPVDINLEMTRYALDVAIGSLFHLSRDEGVERMMDSLGTLLREAEQRIWNLVSLPQSMTMKFPKYKKALQDLRSTVDDLISERRRNKLYPNDLLSRAITAYESEQTTYPVLQDKIVAYLTSAHETTANSLVWAFYELAQRPEIVKRVREEVDAVCGSGPIDYEAVKKLTYTRQVFDEALRLYPSVWTMSREAAKDDLLPLDDGSMLKVSKGTTIMICPYAMHRKDSYWPNPLAFDPDRFSPEETKKRPKSAYIPFSGGARLCLGFRFAQIEAVIALAMMLQRYDLSLIPGQEIHPVPNITLRPNSEVLFHLSFRKDATATARAKADVQTTGDISQCPVHHHPAYRETANA